MLGTYLSQRREIARLQRARNPAAESGMPVASQPPAAEG
jgi:hypothetical protein